MPHIPTARKCFQGMLFRPTVFLAVHTQSRSVPSLKEHYILEDVHFNSVVLHEPGGVARFPAFIHLLQKGGDKKMVVDIADCQLLGLSLEV